MKNLNAVLYKQLKDTLKNPATLSQFIMYPMLAFIMSVMAVPDFEGVPEDMLAIIAESMPKMVTMMASVFVGMGLITVVPGIITEDTEKKSLRFLTMAGVKPVSYLVGVSGIIFFVSIFTSVAFSLIGGFRGLDFLVFTAAMMSGVAASIVLGATVGVLSGAHQAASGLALPAALILGFGPMIAQFNDTVARVIHVFYTQQLNLVADYLNTGGADTPLWQSFGIMWANVAVLGLLFVIVFKKKWSVE